MYARVTPYKMKAGSREEATAVLEGLKSRIMELEGMERFINVMDDDGKGYIVAISRNAETSPETMAKIKALWGAFGEFLEAEPVAENYGLVANWS